MISTSVNLYKFRVKYDTGDVEEIEYDLKYDAEVTGVFEMIAEDDENEAIEYLTETVMREESQYGAVSAEYLGNREIKFEQFE